MEEIREAAVAYYKAGPRELKDLANQFFRSMDVNGDGRVSLQEFQQFTAQQGWHRLNNMFREFDRDGDGNLDFYEVLTFYYLIKSGRPCCDSCRVFLKGLFFTCVECRDRCTGTGTGSTFDLCSQCYGDHRFNHEHSFIIDNYLLLEHKRLLSQGPSNSRSLLTNSNTNYYHHHQGAPVNYNAPYYQQSPQPIAIPYYQQSTQPVATPYYYQPSPPLPQPIVAYTSQPTSWQPMQIEGNKSKSITWQEAFQAFETGFQIGSYVVLAATVCSIM